MKHHILVALLGAFTAPAIAQPQPKPPNIIVILADDLGRADYSAYGTKDIRAPHIDQLCREGMEIQNFYANSPFCSPTPKQKLHISRARGAALPMLVAHGWLGFAFGIGIVGAVIGNGVEPLLDGSVRVIDPEAVLGTIVIAPFSVLCCWGGYYFLRLAFGNEG